MPTKTPSLHLAQDVEADALLSRSALALLIGMVLDQQVPLEWAFRGPAVLVGRLGHDLDATELAEMDPDKFVALAVGPPGIHRFPAAMARRIQALCQHLVESYGGSADAVWAGVKTGDELYARIKALPGFGEHKARIFVALLGKQLGVRPKGWQEAAGHFGEEGIRRSVADITGPDSLAQVRSYKQQMKAAAKAASPAK